MYFFETAEFLFFLVLQKKKDLMPAFWNIAMSGLIFTTQFGSTYPIGATLLPVSFIEQLSMIVVISESFDFLNRIRMSDEVSLSGFPE